MLNRCCTRSASAGNPVIPYVDWLMKSSRFSPTLFYLFTSLLFRKSCSVRCAYPFVSSPGDREPFLSGSSAFPFSRRILLFWSSSSNSLISGPRVCGRHARMRLAAGRRSDTSPLSQPRMSPARSTRYKPLPADVSRHVRRVFTRPIRDFPLLELNRNPLVPDIDVVGDQGQKAHHRVGKEPAHGGE